MATKRPKIETWDDAEELLSERHLPGTRIAPLWTGNGYFTFAVRPPDSRFRLEQIGPRGGHTSFLYLSARRERILREHLTGRSFG